MPRKPLALLLGLLLIAAALIALDFPRRHEIRNDDEHGYLSGGPEVLEGIMPGHQAAPAGPFFWAGWTYMAGSSARQFIAPDPDLRSVPPKVRVFLAIDRALFHMYHDPSMMRMVLLGFFGIVSVCAVAAGFGFGRRYAGLPGALAVGGLAAVTPLLVDFTSMARPYAAAWAFAILAIYFAGTRLRHRWLIAAIFFGLSVGSRIDMLVLFPFVLWELACWREPGTPIPWLRTGIASVLATLLIAPWLLIGIIGNLRSIATIQAAGAPGGRTPLAQTLLDFTWGQGLLPALVLFACVPLLGAGVDWRRRLRASLFGVYFALLCLRMFWSTGFGLHHSGAAVVGFLLGCAFPMRVIANRWPRGAMWAAVAILILPVAQTLWAIRAHRAAYVPEDACGWVEQNVLPGSRLYILGWTNAFHQPLPTRDASNVLWSEVADISAGDRKFASGLSRFGLPKTQMPRGLAEVNLVQEREIRRGWFILGGGPPSAGPRFDIRLVHSSPVFGIQDFPAAFAEKPGVVIWRGMEPPPFLGPPTIAWTGAVENSTYLYCPSQFRLVPAKKD